MITAGFLRVASRLLMLIVLGSLFLAIVQQEQNAFLYIVAAIFFGLAIYTNLKAKEQSIKSRVQIEEKERARIRARQND